MPPPLIEVDAVEVLVIVDNEVDSLSSYQASGIKVSGQMLDIAGRAPLDDPNRGDATNELRMSNICYSRQGEKEETILFDTGPEEMVWELNSKRLKADVAAIEVIQLSHWHRDHSGGMLKAVKMITEAKGQNTTGTSNSLVVDLHPNRPQFRGFMGPRHPVSMEADPTFEEIEAAGGQVSKNDTAHTILDDMFLVSGEIPRVTPYETGVRRGITFNGTTKTWESDELILDERFLMCNIAGKGVVVFTGCSHAGVVNASRHALELAPGSPLYAVIGGYHLVGPNEPQVQQTIQDLEKLNPLLLMPGHCSGWRAKVEIERVMPGRLAPSTVGTEFTL